MVVNTLSELTVGQRSQVVEVVGTDDVSIRLLEMGLTPGVEIEVIGAAPLGDPIEIAVRGYRLSIRKTEASRVVVQLPE
jgi:ferrous iron transport protein A